MKTVLITGASSGIGAEFARVFAQNSYQLVLVARRKEKLEALANELSEKYKVKTYIFPFDLSQPGAADAVLEYVKGQGITIDTLVNNAGFGDFGPFLETNWEKENQMMQLNMVALTHLTKVFAKEMVEKNIKGAILNVASTAAFQPGPLWAVYFATKAYVLSFTEAIAFEFRNQGIKVTALCPGPTESEFGAVANVVSSDLFDSKIPDSRQVAKFGFKQLMKNKTVAVHGFKNRFLALFLLRFTPRKMVPWMVYRMSKPKN